jgi:ribosome recycling factor
MPAAAIEKQCRSEMGKVIDYFKEELRGVRAGRASVGLVDHLRIEVPSYGATSQLRELATISVPDPSTILIKPFDPSILKDIERGIQTSDVGLTPSNDGKRLRLPVPQLSGERRQQLVQQVRRMGETQKVALRNVRRTLNKQIDVEKKDSRQTEDEAEDAKDAIQKLTKDFEDQVDSLVAAKTREIEEV